MPYSIIWESQGAWFRYSGTVSNADLVDSMQEFCDHSDFNRYRYYIATPEDGLDISALTTDVMHKVAEIHRRGSDRNPHIRGIAISRTSLGKGLTGVYYNWHQANGGRWTLEVAGDEDEARALARAAVGESIDT